MKSLKTPAPAPLAVFPKIVLFVIETLSFPTEMAPPFAAALPENVHPEMVTNAPGLSIAPPLPLTALLFENVQSVTLSGPSPVISSPPPLAPPPYALPPVTTTFVRDSDLLGSMLARMFAPEEKLTPFAIVTSEIVTVTSSMARTWVA